MTTPYLSLDAVNAFDQQAFVAALGGLFEGPPWIVAQAWYAGPFASVDQLYQALCDVMQGASSEQQVALIRAHPDLVGRAALAGALSPASTSEQAAAGLDRLTPDEIATITHLNAEYQGTFGFPFVICAREHKKASILAGFATRLRHTREQEIASALAEVAKICQLRLLDTVHAG
jgi:2-oxo-4-hydroxy-4-carboxy-5-ureidoimidazoline decarboxylase